jgi:hypothetical protein
VETRHGAGFRFIRRSRSIVRTVEKSVNWVQAVEIETPSITSSSPPKCEPDHGHEPKLDNSPDLNCGLYRFNPWLSRLVLLSSALVINGPEVYGWHIADRRTWASVTERRYRTPA